MTDQEANGVVGAGPEEEQHRLAKQLLQGGHFSFQCRVNPLRCLRSEVKSLQSCPTLCDPVDCSLPSSSVHGILQARILEWVAISFSRGSSWPRDRTWVSCIGGRSFNLWATREAWSKSHQNSGTQHPHLCQGLAICSHSNIQYSISSQSMPSF